MDRLENLAQTYRQAPWRKQLQMIGLFALVLVFTALIAGIYLNVSARTAAVGREIQYMQGRIEELSQKIEDDQGHLATLLSSEEMGPRAEKMGFEPVQTDEIVYLAVPGYLEQQPAVLAPYIGRQEVSAPVIPVEYTESVFDWLIRQVEAWYAEGEAQP